MKRRKRKPAGCSGGPCDLRLTAEEISMLMSIRDAVEVKDRAVTDRPLLAQLVARGLVWRCSGGVGLTWYGMGVCGRVIEPAEILH